MPIFHSEQFKCHCQLSKKTPMACSTSQVHLASLCHSWTLSQVVITVGHLPRTTQMSQYAKHFLTQIRAPRGRIQGVPVARPLQDLVHACLLACPVTTVFLTCLDANTVCDPPTLRGLALASHPSSSSLMTSFPSMEHGQSRLGHRPTGGN